MFDRVVPADPAVERRKMFGYPAAFVRGHMFAGLHEDRLVLRLGDDALAEAKQRGAQDFEPMPGRPMRGWVVVPREVLADVGLTGRWITRALRHVSQMPLKVKRPMAKKTAMRRTR